MTRAVRALEKDNLEKYSGGFYDPKTITVMPPASPTNYAELQSLLRLELVAEFTKGATVLDLCCGTGEHLLWLARTAKQGIGYDFSKPFIKRAEQNVGEAGLDNVYFLCGNARNMPFQNGSFDVVYSFACLYHIPEIRDIIYEISRVLKVRGRCVLDMGNVFSLNTIVCKHYPEAAELFVVSVWDMKNAFRDAGLSIIGHRAFQILPIWADRPRWLWPFLWPGWRKLLQKKVRGKMLDEWISNLPILKLLAFRHLFVCEKE